MPDDIGEGLFRDLAEVERGNMRATADALSYLFGQIEEIRRVRPQGTSRQVFGQYWPIGPWCLNDLGNPATVSQGAMLRPPDVSGTYHNYTPTGIDTACGFEVEPTAAVTITGIRHFSQFQKRLLIVRNRDSTDAITLAHENAGSTDIYRFDLPHDRDFVIGPRRAVELYYDPGRERWTVVSTTGTQPGQVVFPATANPSSDPNVLDEYEEGAYTPSDQSGAGLTFTDVQGIYVKIGRHVLVGWRLTYPATADVSQAKVSLPFAGVTLTQTPMFGTWILNGNGAASAIGVVPSNAAYVAAVTSSGGTAVTNADLATATLFMGFSYYAGT